MTTPIDASPHTFTAPGPLLANKHVVVSGGSRGIGRGICEVFAREGASVAFTYVSNDEAAQETLEVLRQFPGKHHAFKVSVTDRAGIKAMVTTLMEDWKQIDVLVNNAAINKADTFISTTEESWMHVVNTNVNGLYYMTKPILRQMVRQRKGSIVNITSIAAQRAVPTSVHYATSKAAVIGFTKCLARESAAFGVTINGIAAGIYDTDLGNSLPGPMLGFYEQWVPKGRLGLPQELGEVACFLASDRNTYMQGEIITVDGGATV
jgi:3-oxoacyl-[acyl-carrier protein] reductase